MHARLSLLSLSSFENDCRFIFEIVTINILLEDLLLGNNRLLSSGFCKFAEALFNLKMLICNNTQIAGKCVRELAIVIKHSSNLQDLEKRFCS